MILAYLGILISAVALTAAICLTLGRKWGYQDCWREQRPEPQPDPDWWTRAETEINQARQNLWTEES